MMAGNSPSWYFEKSGFNVLIFVIYLIETLIALIEKILLISIKSV